MKLVYGKIHAFLFIRFRKRRMKRFFSLFMPTLKTNVLDVGGTSETWTSESESHAEFPVTLLNILDYGLPDNERFTSVCGDATQMSFKDQSFDIVFSNSVIEHVGTWEDQQAFAREVRRVAHSLWIQTPARHFPIEAHLLAPFIQYLSKPLQHRIARWTPRGILQPEVVHQIVDEVRLLTYSEMRRLFPDCLILRERVLGLTKSYIAVRGVSVRGMRSNRIGRTVFEKRRLQQG
jgi:predicted SAM-dependent methyltransferase